LPASLPPTQSFGTSVESCQSSSSIQNIHFQTNRAIHKADLLVWKFLQLMCCNELINIINNLLHVVIDFFGTELLINKESVNLVKHKDWPDTFVQCLDKNLLSLDGLAFRGIHHEQRTIRHSQGGADFSVKLNMSWRVNQI